MNWRTGTSGGQGSPKALSQKRRSLSLQARAGIPANSRHFSQGLPPFEVERRRQEGLTTRREPQLGQEIVSRITVTVMLTSERR
jgi:hypothetical protein